MNVRTSLLVLMSVFVGLACGNEGEVATDQTVLLADAEPVLTETERRAAEKAERLAAEAKARQAAEREAAAALAAEQAAKEKAAAEDDYRNTEAYKKASAERRRKRHEKRRLERERKAREAAAERGTPADEATAAARPADYETTTLALPAGAQPLMRFDETIFRFEPIEEGDKVTHSFKFTNVGNAPLEITNADADCGCTYPSYPFLPIEPGKTGEVTVTFNSKGKFGAQKRIITLYTNTPEKQYKLLMEGEVITEVARPKPDPVPNEKQ